MAFCSPCPTGDLTNYTVDYCDLGAALLKGGISRVVLQKCAITNVSMSDPAEWTTLVGADDVEVTAQGQGVFPKPTYETFEIDACGTKVNTDAKLAIEFSTRLLDPTADGHNTFIDDFNKAAQNYTAYFISCDNRFYFRYAWVTTQNGGFPINEGKASLIDDGKYKKLNLEMELDATSGLYKSIVLTTALKTAFGI